jgi:hypothetical protein
MAASIEKLEEFGKKMYNNKYSYECLQDIDGSKYLFNCSDSAIYDLTNYIPQKKQIIHACLERHINDKVEVINFIRDVREDWGDDGGYCFYVGKYKGQYVFGSNYISYNGDFSTEFIEVNELEKGDENEEYILFDTLLEVESFIGRMLFEAKKLSDEDEEWGYESWDLEEEDFESPFMHICMRNLGSAFCEYPEQNIKRILSLTTEGIYVKNLDDPIEFYRGWADDKDIEPIMTFQVKEKE